MHELSIAHEIYATCRAAVEGNGGGRIEAARVAVGELTAIEPELLRFAWEAVVAGGADAGARLDIDWHPARQHCPACDADKPRVPGSWLRLCPDCGGVLAIDGGDELDVLQVTFVHDDEVDAGREEGSDGGNG